uniref:Uncharacterized protein n=1 Tax=Anguilla anguilla TaxID=7936 RepID=A0A0E9Q921_ANGAN
MNVWSKNLQELCDDDFGTSFNLCCEEFRLFWRQGSCAWYWLGVSN